MLTIGQSVKRPNTLRTDIDNAWLVTFQTALMTVADFIIARIQNAPRLDETAKNVICIVDGVFISVATIEEQCGNHGWNSMVYEAWAWERKNRIHLFAQRLNPIERDALLLYANFREPLDISDSDTREALAEASRDLYGELDDELDDDCDDDFEEWDSLYLSDTTVW